MAKMLQQDNHAPWCDCRCWYVSCKKDWACPSNKTARKREERKWKKDWGIA